MDELNQLLEFLNTSPVVNSENYREIQEQLLRYENFWQQCPPQQLFQCIQLISSCYEETNRLEEALSVQMGQADWISENYPYETTVISHLHHLIGTTYAYMNRHKDAVKAFMTSIYYTLTPQSVYTGYNFFSFRAPSQFTIDDLANNVITVVAPTQFNDPVDCMVFPWLEYKKKAECTMEKEKRMVEAITEAYGHLKVRCFVSRRKLPSVIGAVQESSKQTPEQFDILMWSHYAQNHTGICVQYNLPKSIMESDRELLTVSNLSNVNYVDHGDVTQSMYLSQAFFTKSKEWEYEDEVRLLHYDPTWNTPFKPIKLPQGSVKAVYFGLKCSDETKAKVRKALQYENVDFYQIEVEPKDIYKLHASKV